MTMVIGVYFNRNYISDNKPHIELIQSKFEQNGCSVRLVNSNEDLTGIEVLFVLGGDGTILTVAAECAKRGIKIIGVNYGHMGFLAEFEPEKLEEAVSFVLGGKYRIQERSMLEVVCGNNVYYALNDFVVQRNTGGANFANTVNIRAEIDGVTVDNFSSDGIVVSTPTGSTAYSLAAGGSVLAPEVNAFILTPICAHSLHSRPIVFSDASILSVYTLNARASLVLSVDGKVVETVGNGQVVTVKKAKFCAEFIIKEEKNFFNELLKKLNIWSK